MKWTSNSNPKIVKNLQVLVQFDIKCRHISQDIVPINGLASPHLYAVWCPSGRVIRQGPENVILEMSRRGQAEDVPMGDEEPEKGHESAVLRPASQL